MWLVRVFRLFQSVVWCVGDMAVDCEREEREREVRVRAEEAALCTDPPLAALGHPYDQ